MARLIDGKALAERVKGEVRTAAAELLAQRGVRVGLAAIRVGDDQASEIYVRGKIRDCGEVGFASSEHHLSAQTTQAELLALIEALNRDPKVHGILVQLPLPKQIDPAAVLRAVDPRKDVDGFHPMNAGKLLSGQPGIRPCTPLGIMRMLDEFEVRLEGATAVVLGRSNIVGKPMALLLLERNCTVVMCHSRTRDLPGEVRRADVLVAAVGRAELVRGDWIKEGAAIIDVGMNRNASGKLVGDVAQAEVAQRAAFITPVPGGVGPMTRAMLMANTLQAALALSQ
jgi:methylenetetrahydrofolate dehydrogenase (NADP+)/methenyltetrahydrofolate cyclohydrolase